MKIRSYKYQFIFAALALSTVSLGYRSFDRQREIHDFFETPEDLAWAKSYLNKTINYCDAPWQETRVDKINNINQYSSPSSLFKVNIYTNSLYEEGFRLINSKTKEIILELTFSWNPKGAGLGNDDFKWARDERFLIFRKPITMDSDWTTSQIYAADTSTGDIIYLGDSEFYDCELRNW